MTTEEGDASFCRKTYNPHIWMLRHKYHEFEYALDFSKVGWISHTQVYKRDAT